MTKVMVTVLVKMLVAYVCKNRQMMARAVVGVMAKVVVKVILDMMEKCWKPINTSGGKRGSGSDGMSEGTCRGEGDGQMVEQLWQHRWQK